MAVMTPALLQAVAVEVVGMMSEAVTTVGEAEEEGCLRGKGIRSATTMQALGIHDILTAIEQLDSNPSSVAYAYCVVSPACR